jgi:hypothetical protein
MSDALALDWMNIFLDVHGLAFVSHWKHEDAMSLVRPLWQSCRDLVFLVSYFELDYLKPLRARHVECFRRFQADLREEPPTHGVWRAIWNVRAQNIQLSKGRINILMDLADDGNGLPLWLEDDLWRSLSYNLSGQLQLIVQESAPSKVPRPLSSTRSRPLHVKVRGAGQRLALVAKVSKTFRAQLKISLACLRSLEEALRAFERDAEADEDTDYAETALTFLSADFLTERLFEDLLALSS